MTHRVPSLRPKCWVLVTRVMMSAPCGRRRVSQASDTWGCPGLLPHLAADIIRAKYERRAQQVNGQLVAEIWVARLRQCSESPGPGYRDLTSSYGADSAPEHSTKELGCPHLSKPMILKDCTANVQIQINKSNETCLMSIQYSLITFYDF